MTPRPLALFLCVFLAGCASAPPPVASLTPESIRAQSTVRRDDFKRYTSVSSPKIQISSRGVVDWCSFELTAQRHDGSEPVYFLTLSSQRENWAFWELAADADGTRFPLAQDVREVGYGGIVYEISSARLTRDYLDRIAASPAGIAWRAYGQRAQVDFQITPNHVQGFLARADADLK